jgi:membrane-bound lytic murein transglycosylase A
MRTNRGLIGFVLAVVVAVVAAGLAWWWLRPVPPPKPPPKAAIATLQPVDFDALPGWAEDDHAAALAAFKVSCTRLMKLAADRPLGRQGLAGRGGDWRSPCAEAAALPAGDAGAARAFFESHFRPVAVTLPTGAGRFTGYYEPLLRGSRTRDQVYATPLHRRPDDLLDADLGDFKEALKGQRIVGRVDGRKFVPYHDRGAIVDGALDGRGLEILWVDSPVDAFFLQIQGSGVVELTDGTRVRVGYAAKNGRAYHAIGRELIRRQVVPKEKMSMQAIREWLAAHPKEADKVMRLNESYVFFFENDGDGPIGAQGVVLSPGRSLAVDRDIYPMGVPVYVDTLQPGVEKKPLRRLMVAQDTGGAINGPIRGDVYFGTGDAAGDAAGRMNHPGTWYLLLPRDVSPPAALY